MIQPFLRWWKPLKKKEAMVFPSEHYLYMEALKIEIAILKSLKNQGLIDEREYLEAEEELKKMYLKKSA